MEEIPKDIWQAEEMRP